MFDLFYKCRKKNKKIFFLVFVSIVIFIAIYLANNAQKNMIGNNPVSNTFKELFQKEDTRVGFNEESFKKDLKVEYLYVGTLKPSQNYIPMRDNGYVKGKDAEDTLLVIKTKNGKGIDTFLKKIELYQGKNLINANYSGYKLDNDELILFVTYPGIHSNIKDYKIKFFAKSMTKDSDFVFEKEISEKKGIYKYPGISEQSNLFKMGNNVGLKLSKTPTSSHRKEGDKIYSTKNIRFVFFGSEKIDIKKFKVLDKSGKEIHSEIKTMIKKDKQYLENYNGDKVFAEITLVVTIDNKGDASSKSIDDIEKKFNSYVLSYGKNSYISLDA